MFNISTEHKEKRQQLIYSDDFESDVQRLELLNTVTEEKNDVFDLPYYVPWDVKWKKDLLIFETSHFWPLLFCTRDMFAISILKICSRRLFRQSVLLCYRNFHNI